MSYALYCPFSDIDLTNKQIIKFRLDGGGQIDATVLLPSVGGVALEGGVYWAYKSSFAGSLLQAVEDALNLADPSGGGWNVSIDSATLPLKVDILRGPAGGIATWFIDWTAGTFDGLWLGYNVDITAATSSSVVSPFQSARTWFHKFPAYKPERDQHRGVILKATTYGGASQTTSYGSTTFDLDFEVINKPSPYVYTWAAADPLLFSIVPGLTQGDPNIALDALVACMALGRKPLRYVIDIGGGSSIKHDLQAQTQESMASVDRMITDRRNEPRYYDVNIPLQEYVAP